MSDRASLVIVDGSYYLFRAYHGMPALSNAKGEPTGAIYGALNMIRRLLADTDPSYFAVVFDAPGKNFRHQIYPDYKANRPPTPEELIYQIAPLHEIIDALGIPLLRIDGVEADDVIATLARRAEAAGISTLISSGDKDLMQLVNDHIKIINTLSNTRYDTAGVQDKFGVLPKQIGDYLALVGDSSDNIPGVPKVGPKTAAKWLAQYTTLDNIIAHADELRGKVGEYLRENLAQLQISRQLVQLDCAVHAVPAPQDLLISAAQPALLKTHYERWGFQSWLRDLHAGDASTVATPLDSPNYETIFTTAALTTWLTRLKQSTLFAFDTETTSLDYMQAKLVGLSFSDRCNEAAYVPLAHDDPNAPTQLDLAEVLEAMRPLLEDARYAKVGQHLKYDAHILANYGIQLAGIQHDTMLQSYVLNSTDTRHDMDTLAEKYLGLETIHYQDLTGKGAKQIQFSAVAIDKASPYAAQDADITLQLHEQLFPKLSENAELQAVYTDIEMPLVPVLLHMERRGVKVDGGELAAQSSSLLQGMEETAQKVYKLAGETLNIASPKQIAVILFDKLKLPVREKTASGQPSTSESVLQDLAYEHELPALILHYRSLHKLRSTYTDKLPTQINLDTGRIHTSYHQAVTTTGRLSSSNPNLQNIPIKTPEGRQIRQAFIAPPGYRLLAADYSQIELRIMAHLSQDVNLLQAFADGEDIHTRTAAEIFALRDNEVDAQQRRTAKAINFGLIYGMSPFGLSRQLMIPLKEAREYVERYFANYPKVLHFMQEMRSIARRQGYVETVFKRRLYVPHIHASNSARRKYAERMAINAPMQGTAADIIKRAMLSIHNWLQESKTDAHLIMQVHDELVFEVAEKDLDMISKQISSLMNNAAQLSVPLETHIGIGHNWDEAH